MERRAAERQAVLRANAAAEAQRQRQKELELEEDRKIAEYIAGEEAKKRYGRCLFARYVAAGCRFTLLS